MDDKFNLAYEIDRYCKRITANITAKKKRQSVFNEYQTFIEEYVYDCALKGISEKTAFNNAIDELGEEEKLTELLADVNNSLKIPSLIKKVFIALIALMIFSTYFWVDNDSYRSYFILFLWLFFIILFAYAVYIAIRYLRALKIRLQLISKLKKIEKLNNEKLVIKKGVFASIFRVTQTPEIIYESGKKRYIIKLWPTVRGKKTLRFYDNGLYSYSANIGYVNLPTNPRGHILTGGEVFCPENIGYYRKFANTHTEFVELKKGMHIFPNILWKECESEIKDNIKIILLSPVPYNILGIERGRERKLNDGDKFTDFAVWSGEGFVSLIKNKI